MIEQTTKKTHENHINAMLDNLIISDAKHVSLPYDHRGMSAGYCL